MGKKYFMSMSIEKLCEKEQGDTQTNNLAELAINLKRAKHLDLNQVTDHFE